MTRLSVHFSSNTDLWATPEALFNELDKEFAVVDIDAAVDPATLTGRSEQQVDEFLAQTVAPIRERYKSEAASVDIRV